MYHFYITSYKYKCMYNKRHNFPIIRLLHVHTNPTCHRATEIFWFKNLGLPEDFS